MKRKLTMLALLCLLTTMAWAQDRTISGVVTSADDGAPLPGVTVLVKGTSAGGVTDIDGNYKVIVPEGGETLVFNFIGYKTTEIAIGTQTKIDVALATDAKELEEVIVTAMGIEREKKALGYAVSSVGKEQLEQKTEGDIGRILRGKASGVQINQTNGVSGSATNIIIRGYTSITGSNQPLFIVDGVPFDGGTNNQGDFEEGQTESSRFLDLDPNNIESIDILKGLSATVLYGDRGRNGVILVTTKNGSSRQNKKGTEITLNQSYFVNEIASMPDYNETYGNGFFQDFGFFFSNWGPAFSELESVGHPYGNFGSASLQSAFPEFVGQDYEYKSYAPAENFFNKGSVTNTSLNIQGGNEKSSFGASYGYLYDEGFTPGNSLARNTFGFGGKSKLANNFTVGATFNFTITDYETPPISSSLGSGATGTGASVFGDVFYTPRSVDLNGLPFQNPLTGGSVYYRRGNDIQNPRWTVANSGVTQQVNRFFGNTYLAYDINDWMKFTYRVGLDTYDEKNQFFQHRGGVDGEVTGILRTTEVSNTIWNHDFLFNGSRDLTDDINLVATVGLNARRDEYTQTGIESTDQVVFGVAKHENFINHNHFSSALNSDLEYEESQNRVGLFAQTEFAYRGYLYLTLAARNDWGNTVEDANQAIFYPAASIAFDATTAIPAMQNSSIINYLKVRLGYGSSAGFPDPFLTRNRNVLNARAFVDRNGNVAQSNNVSIRLGNSDLKPERIGEIELGFETSWLNDKLGLNVSLFEKTTTDLLLDQDLDHSTGYSVRQVNAGELRVRGIEVDFNASPLKINDFNWRIAGNFQAIRSDVTDLPDEVGQIGIAGYSDLGNFAIEGKPFGVIQSYAREKDENGNFIIDALGFYQVSNDISIIGNPQPDWTSAISNTFSWKGLSLMVEFQYRHGGDVYSRTAANLVGRGVTKDTEFDRRRTYVLDGVTLTGEPNTTQIAATNYYFDVMGFGAEDVKVFDGSTIRLNEVSLSYVVPKTLLEKTPFGSASITASGFNLWFDAVNMPEHVNFDTNSVGTGVGNGFGLDFLNGPSSRRYGASLKLTF